MALEEVGAVVGAQGGPALAVAADRFLHLAVGVQQALLACPRLGPSAPEGSKEPMAPLAEVGREEGIQLLPAEEGRWVLGMRRGSGAGGRARGAEGFRGWHAAGQGQARPRTGPRAQQHAWWARGLKGRPGDQQGSCEQARLPASPWLEGFSAAPVSPTREGLDF